MTICRVHHKNNYTVVNNTIITDKRLSWKAKGIWLYAFSRMDNWQFYVSDLVQQSTDGEDAVYSGLRELEACGYLERKQENKNGKFGKIEYIFHETPQDLKKSLPQRDFPHAVSSDAENPALISTEEKVSTKNTLSKEKKEKREREVEEQTEQIMSFTFNDLPDTIPEEKRKIPFSKENIKRALRKYGLDLVTCVLSSFCKLKPKERNSLGAGWFFYELKQMKGIL